MWQEKNMKKRRKFGLINAAIYKLDTATPNGAHS